MFKNKQGVSRIALTLITAVSLLQFSTHTLAFDDKLKIYGSSEFDNSVNYDLFGNLLPGNEGEFGIVSGGTAIKSTFDTDSVVTGSNPVGAIPVWSDPVPDETGRLTQLNDGVGFKSAGSLTDGDYIVSQLFSKMSLTNTSSNSLFEVSLKLDYEHWVNADNTTITLGNDPYPGSIVESRLSFNNIFWYSRLLSDTDPDPDYGDFDSHLIDDSTGADGFTGTTGKKISHLDSDTLNILLNPGETFDVKFVWFMEGLNFETTGFMESSMDAFLSIDSVKRSTVPLPGTLFLVGIGVILLSVQRRLRRKL